MTLIDLLRTRARDQGHLPAYTFVADDETSTTWTWAELERRAAHVAAALAERSRPGDRALLLYPQGLDYLAALFGCMRARVLAVPLQPPGRHRAASALPKLDAIAADGGVAVALTTSALLDEMQALVAPSPRLAATPWLSTDDVPVAAWSDLPVADEEIAYLQYTSGSTSTPKGVMVSHGNLLYNLHDFDAGYGHDADSVMVSWLPTFHDLGLVYGVFMPLYVGFHGVLLDPLAFLARPARWLRAIHRFRGTHACAPNFAFDLCAAKTTAEERATLDLSSWKVLLNGAEPIRHDSEAAFVAALGPCGVSWSTVSHAYGMSEATAVISKEPLGSARVFLDVDAASLERHRAVPVTQDAPGARRLAGCGVTTHDTRVVVADPDTFERQHDGHVGELWVGGPTVAQGYWNNPEATADTFQARTTDGDGPFLRTGDLGFVWGGQVFVTGRLKDMIIVRGENHYPQDLEWSVQSAHAAIRPSCVAAFALGDDGEIGIVAEVYPERLPNPPDPVFGAVREAIGEHGLSVARIVLVAPRAVFKTSSGKIMRRQTRAALLGAELPALADWTRPVTTEPVAPPTDDLRAALAAAPGPARAGLLADHILTRAAALLGLPADALDADTPLKELGLDSVQAVELTDTIGLDLGRDLPVTLLFEHPTAARLASALLAVTAPVAPVAAPAAAPSPEALDDDLSDDELAALLRAELEGL